MNISRTIKSYLFALLGFAIAVAFDQISKLAAVIFLKGKPPFILIDGVFQFLYLENRGAAFGMMQDRQIIFIIGAVLITMIVILLYGRIPQERKYLPLRICAVLLVSGAVGNLIDRIRLNYVIDFLYFNLIDFPIFNVADCYVVTACFMFVLLILFYYKEEDDFHSLNFRRKDGKEE